jgi:cytoskeleton protein RodZ
MQQDPALQAAAESAPAVEPVGETLARARQALGLSVSDVAQQLKFGIRQIEALEAGRFESLPGGTFARGMVRAYARLLRLDPDTLVARVAPILATPDNAEAMVAMRRPIPITDSSRRSNLIYAALSLVILAVIAGVIVEWQQERSRAARLTFVPAAQAPAEAPRAEIASTVTPPIAPLEASTSDARVKGAQADGAPAATPAPETPAPQAAAPATAPAVAGGAHRIVLRFERESWVEVRGRGGKLLMAQLNPADSERVVQGNPPFSVVIGNAHHVRLAYDDRAVDLTPHIKVEVARFTLE